MIFQKILFKVNLQYFMLIEVICFVIFKFLLVREKCTRGPGQWLQLFKKRLNSPELVNVIRLNRAPL